MKAFTLVGLLAAGALGLSACGVQATVDQAVTSLGSSPYLQLHVTGSLTSTDPSLTKAAFQLKNLSLDVNLASTNGANLSAAGSSVDAEVVLAVSGTNALDARSIGGNLYVELNLASLNALPGANVPPSALAAAGQMLDGRWFEIPQSLLTQLAAAHQPSAAQAAKAQSVARAAITALSTLVEKAPYTSSKGTFTETGTLQSIVDALIPVLGPATGATTPTVSGTYSISLTTSGATATGGSVSITSSGPSTHPAPSPVTVSLQATASHGTVPVATPAGAIVVTPSMLSQFSSIGG
ncbi:MAG TPA: hypothetical protein PLS29_07285 [Acidimicrobiales bacterium]|nr:MAG: hypothetical protein B7Z69_00695 [Actinobacteria bacterium 21-73-9]HQU26817.1 hypothetical protein [Acidimicrobiales bacterium]